jgi:hypothetical protein
LPEKRIQKWTKKSVVVFFPSVGFVGKGGELRLRHGSYPLKLLQAKTPASRQRKERLNSGIARKRSTEFIWLWEGRVEPNSDIKICRLYSFDWFSQRVLNDL